MARWSSHRLTLQSHWLHSNNERLKTLFFIYLRRQYNYSVFDLHFTLFVPQKAIPRSQFKSPVGPIGDPEHRPFSNSPCAAILRTETLREPPYIQLIPGDGKAINLCTPGTRKFRRAARFLACLWRGRILNSTYRRRGLPTTSSLVAHHPSSKHSEAETLRDATAATLSQAERHCPPLMTFGEERAFLPPR